MKQLSQSIVDDGPTSGSEEIYWLAVQVPVSYSGILVDLSIWTFWEINKYFAGDG